MHPGPTYMVVVGMEHEHFTNQFPFWEVNKQVQALNCKVRPTSFSYILMAQTRYYCCSANSTLYKTYAKRQRKLFNRG